MSSSARLHFVMLMSEGIRAPGAAAGETVRGVGLALDNVSSSVSWWATRTDRFCDPPSHDLYI